MKIIKTLFAALIITSLFMACEAESVDDEVAVEINDSFSDEADEDHIPIPGQDN